MKCHTSSMPFLLVLLLAAGSLTEVLIYKDGPTPDRLALIEQYLKATYGR